MQPVSVMALFCEDIREEKDNRVTLVGILPDNLNIVGPDHKPTDGVPIISKLGVYVRINFDPDADLPETRLRLVHPNMPEPMELGSISRDVIKQAKEQAKEGGHVVAGLLLRAVIGGFPPVSGLLRAEVVMADRVYLAGALNFRVSNASSEQPQPS